SVGILDQPQTCHRGPRSAERLRAAGDRPGRDPLVSADTLVITDTSIMMHARIRRLTPSVALPRYESAEAAGFDLAASQDAVVAPGAVVLVPTGLVIQAPEGHFLAIL